MAQDERVKVNLLQKLCKEDSSGEIVGGFRARAVWHLPCGTLQEIETGKRDERVRHSLIRWCRARGVFNGATRFIRLVCPRVIYLHSDTFQRAAPVRA